MDSNFQILKSNYVENKFVTYTIVIYLLSIIFLILFFYAENNKYKNIVIVFKTKIVYRKN